MWRRRRIAISALAVLAASAVAAAPAEPGEPDLALGKKLYKQHCLECHGKRGEGDGEKAVRMGFKPRDFTLGSFKCRCTPSGALPTDADLARVIVAGLPGTAMRGLRDQLSAAEVAATVAYVKSLAPAFERPVPECVEIPDPPAAEPETAAEGRQIYRLLRCWTCHGFEGKGDGPAAKGLVDDWGDKIRVYDFTRPKRFKCGGEPQDLYRTLHTGLNGSPMPSYSEAIGFAGDAVGDLAPLADAFEPGALAELEAYVARQPDAATVESMSPPERRDLVDRRTWALIRYLESLVGR